MRPREEPKENLQCGIVRGLIATVLHRGEEDCAGDGEGNFSMLLGGGETGELQEDERGDDKVRVQDNIQRNGKHNQEKLYHQELVARRESPLLEKALISLYLYFRV